MTQIQPASPDDGTRHLPEAPEIGLDLISTTTTPPPPVTATMEVITPEVAKAMLGHFKKNRRLRPAKVRFLSAIMERGEWTNNGEPIKFDWDGNLLDGMHRLTSCVDTNTTFTILVVRGLDPATVHTMDTGAPRGMKDSLFVMDRNTRLAGPLALLWRYEDTGTPPRPAPSHVALERLFDANPTLMDALDTGEKVARGLKGVPILNAATVAAHLTAKEDPAGVEHTDFWYGIATGSGLAATDPRLLFRNWAIGQLAKVPTARAGQDHVFVLLMRAWRAYLKGGTRLTYRWVRSDGLLAK